MNSVLGKEPFLLLLNPCQQLQAKEEGLHKRIKKCSSQPLQVSPWDKHSCWPVHYWAAKPGWDRGLNLLPAIMTMRLSNRREKQWNWRGGGWVHDAHKGKTRAYPHWAVSSLQPCARNFHTWLHCFAPPPIFFGRKNKNEGKMVKLQLMPLLFLVHSLASRGHWWKKEDQHHWTCIRLF